MKISTRTRYGLRLMIYLGYTYPQGAVQLKTIAKQESISEKYLEQIVPFLKTAGLLKTLRGAQGGYFLAKPPAAISLKEIIAPLEGGFELTDCQQTGKKCNMEDKCAAQTVWNNLQAIITQYLAEMNLQELVDNYKALQNKHNTAAANMYYI